MGSILSLLILGSLGGGALPALPRDTATYADEATRALVALGRERHRIQDTTVNDYQATIRYRLSFALGKRGWADLPTIAVDEQEGRIAWQRPNDLRVDLLGRRAMSQYPGVDLTASFSRPFFVPRALGDSIRIFGMRTPVAAAPHPLSAGGAEHYRYAVGDSTVISSQGFRLVVRAVTVVPKRVGSSYVAGQLWIDQATGDVVRFAYRFVGTGLWERPDGGTAGDSAMTDRTNQFINQVLQIEANLEYALIDRQYWMPIRQVVSGRATGPFGIELAVPFEAVTTFRDYEINSGAAVVFTVPMPLTGRRPLGSDSLSPGRRPTMADSLVGRDRVGRMPGGGRWLMHRPPVDSLRAYDQWSDSLTLQMADEARRQIRSTAISLAAIVDSLPAQMTGRPSAGFGITKAAELFRYNRVQGTTVTLSGRAPLPFAFTELQGLVRYGVADQRVMAQAQLRRDAPSGRLTATVQRDLIDTDPWFHGLTLGSSLRAALAGRDDGSYLLALGGRVQWEGSLAPGRELMLTGWLEDQRNAATRARAALPRLFGGSGRFGSSTSVREGLATGIGVRIDQGWLVPLWRVDMQAQMMGSDAAARIALEWRAPTPARLELRLVAGGAVGSRQIPQLGVQVGGAGSVRGYDVGSQQGAVAWASQLTWQLADRRRSPWYVFADAGQAAAVDRLSQTPVLVGVGGGRSLLQGLIRLEVSAPVTQNADRGLRVDVRFGGFQ